MPGAVGVLGSAFNPPHLGHLVLAQEALSQLELSGLLLVPTGVAPHKRIEDDPGAAVRLEMTRLAASDASGLSVSELETGREGPSYTYRTLELLAEERPGEELVWLMGADAAAGLESWKRPQRIVELAMLAIAQRQDVDRRAVEAVLGRLGVDGGGDRERSREGAAAGASFVTMPEIGVSSSMVRERLRAGLPIRYLVPDPVVELIAERGLYGA